MNEKIRHTDHILIKIAEHLNIDLKEEMKKKEENEESPSVVEEGDGEIE